MTSATHHPVPNFRLRAVREARSESRSEFARALRRQAEAMGENIACDETRIARWERGEVRWPRSAYRRVLVALLGVPVEDLGFRPPAHRHGADSPSDDGGPSALLTDRHLAAAMVADRWRYSRDRNAGTAAQPTEGPLVGPALELSRMTLASLEMSAEELCRDYGHRPVAEVAGLAQKQLAVVVRLLADGMRPSERCRLLTVAGWLAAVIGCASFDAGHRRRAEAHRRELREFAMEAGDSGLVAWAWEMAAYFAIAESRFADALEFVRAGDAAATDGAVAARLALHRAKIAARLRDRRQAEAALERAEQIVDGLPWPHDQEHHFAMDDIRVIAHSATAHLWLGNDVAADDCAWQVLARQLTPDNTTRHPMRVSEARITLGVTAARRGDIEQAAYFGMAALDTGRMSLPMLISRAGELEAVLLAGYKNAPVTAEFSDRLRELRRRLGGAASGGGTSARPS